ncbi:hypothetical protein TNCV_11641 [Trichonephila clavipes]|nr:hypothetical protein TNCV_11641 [Trichonephila clavipes]
MRIFLSDSAVRQKALRPVGVSSGAFDGPDNASSEVACWIWLIQDPAWRKTSSKVCTSSKCNKALNRVTQSNLRSPWRKSGASTLEMIQLAYGRESSNFRWHKRLGERGGQAHAGRRHHQNRNEQHYCDICAEHGPAFRCSHDRRTARERIKWLCTKTSVRILG